MKYYFAFYIFFVFTNQVWCQWERHIIDDSGSGADGIRFSDINNDGKLDIVTGWEESSFTKLYLQPEQRNLKKRWPSVLIGKTPSVEDAIFFDINNDNKLDVVSLTEGKTQKIFAHFNLTNDYLNPKNWKQATFPEADKKMSWMYALPMQIGNKNGRDLIAAGKGENAAIGWFEAPDNPDELNNWEWHEIAKIGWIMSIYKKDMDLDGDEDLVITDRMGALTGCRWLENPGLGKTQQQPWKNHFIGAQDLEVMFMCIADVDQDGTNEILVSERTENTIRIYSKYENRWTEQIIKLPTNTGKAKSIEVGDINNDKIFDLIVSTNTLKEKKDGLVYLSGTKLTASTESDWVSISGEHKAKYDKVELIDLDEDGDLDILICEENYGLNSEGLGVVWYENPSEK
ncbi:VCBS repeat-containing protein [Aurantibacter sp.]|uniref:FG-GAP repeat domain-containing protein n=1 Tax=Aurantibacter sp. TaxID=2807103 RepID=UPI003264B0F0